MITRANAAYNQGLPITGNMLKAIACFSMLIDHVGYVLLNDNYAFRCIGRMAFPLFVFLLVEGFFNTRSRRNYIVRLVVAALLSEIPFDLSFSDTFINPYDNSVILTLLLGFICICILDNMIHATTKSGFEYMRILKSIGFVAIFSLGYFLGSDYGSIGILSIISGYLIALISKRKELVFAGIFVCTLLCGLIELWASLDFVFIFLYSGTLGKKSKMLQYAFYLFYPVHLLIIYLIHHLLQ